MRVVLVARGAVRQSRRHTCRAFSTSLVVTDAPQHTGLPPARLRALMSLYHISSAFVTPATLSERIDDAFADPTTTQSLSVVNRSQAELEAQLEAKRNENKVGAASRAVFNGVSLSLDAHRQWSDQRGERQSRVTSALWGTEVDGKPSLETVVETTNIDAELSSRFAESDHENGRREYPEDPSTGFR